MKRIAWKELGCLLLAEVLLAAMLLGGCADGNGDVLQQNGTMPTGTEAATTATTEATGAGCTVPTSAPTAPTVSVISTNPTDPTAPTDPTEDTPVIGGEPTAPTTPKTTTPKPTEPKPTTPKPTEPKPTTPKPTEPKPTEPKPTEPAPTEPAPTEPAPTEPPTEPKEYIDIEALIEYGHQYGVEKWGFQIDREMGLHGDPVGFFPPDYMKITTMEDGKRIIQENVDCLAETWIANGEPVVLEMPDGTISRMRLRIGIEPATDRADYYWIYAYYG